MHNNVPIDTDLLSKIKRFFPDYQPPTSGHDEFTGTPEYLFEQERILPFLQTVFFEQRLVGVQLEHTTRSYFTSIIDHPPDLLTEERDGEEILIEPDYERGSYLKQCSHICLAPMEPVQGNLQIKNCAFVILLFYSGTTSVEIGTRYLGADLVRGTQAFHCEFPEVARILRNSRPFRAKAVKNQEFIIKLTSGTEHHGGAEFPLVDLSAQGLAFAANDPLIDLNIGTIIGLVMDAHGESPIEVEATVRHLATMRQNRQNQFICGVQFDLKTRALASLIEYKFSALQRAFIRSLKDETEHQGITLMLS